MESTIRRLQQFDLNELLPGQKLVVRTHGEAELTVRVPQASKTLVVDKRPCLSLVTVRQTFLDKRTQYEHPSRHIEVGQSWQYGQHFHSHAVISIDHHTAPDPLAALFEAHP